MAVVAWKKEENVAVVSMNHGENRHNLVFATDMLAVLDEILADKSIQAVVLTSGDKKNWCLGVDVPWLMERINEGDTASVKAFMFKMNQVFKTLLLYPMPVIAAINGHAFGNGAILSCACDFRFMKSDRGYFCFPEVDLGIPFLPGMIAFVKKAMPTSKLMEMKLTARKVGAIELAQHHVIEQALPNEEELMRVALEFARSFGKKRGIFGEMKKRLHTSIVNVLEQEDPKIIEKLELFVMD